MLQDEWWSRIPVAEGNVRRVREMGAWVVIWEGTGVVDYEAEIRLSLSYAVGV